MTQETTDSRYNLSTFEFGVAGATTGVITRFCCQPLDVLKIRFQLQVAPIRRNHEESKYRSMFQAAKLIAKEEGFFALWKGHIPAQYLSIIFGAVQFATYEKLNHIIREYRPYTNSFTESLLYFGSGTAAGFSAILLSFPFDVIRTRLVAQGDVKDYKGVTDAAVKILRQDGIRGLGRGLLPACAQYAPLSGITFGFHNIFSRTWRRFEEFLNLEKNESISTTGSLICGLLAGLCGKTIVYPLDLIKKRLQIQGFDVTKTCFKRLPKCSGFFNCVMLTIKFEGFLGLFKGMGPSMVKAGASNAVYFTAYDKTCQFLVFLKR